MNRGDRGNEGGSVQRDVRDYLGLAWRRRVYLIVGFQVGLVLTGLLLAGRPTYYSSTATVLLRPRGVEASDGRTSGPVDYNGGNVETEMRLITSQVIGNRVRAKIGGGGVSASNPPQTDLIRVTAQYKSPDAAAIIANTYAKEYVAYRREQVVGEYDSAIKELELQEPKQRAQIAVLDAQISALAPSSEGRSSASSIRDGLVESVRASNARIATLQLDLSLVTGGTRVIEPANPPSGPASNSFARSALLSFVAGLIGATLLGALAELLDDRILSVRDIERVTSVPVLGVVPKIRAWKSRVVPPVFNRADRSEAAGEAYREIRTSLAYAAAQTNARIIHVTSPHPRAGKTTSVVNLGMLLGWSGQEVTIVDLDLRSPKVCQALNLQPGPGFSDAVMGLADLSDTVLATPAGSLEVVPAGSVTANPAEIFASPNAKKLLARIAASSDTVLVDGGALKPFADALGIVPSADLVVLVVRAGRTTCDQLLVSLDTIRNSGGALAGIIVTGAVDLPRWTRIVERRMARGSREVPTAPVYIRPLDPTMRDLDDLSLRS